MSSSESESVVQYKIMSKVEVVPNFYNFTVYAPKIARKAEPGQFILVMADERSERVPITLSDWDPDKGTVSFYVQEVGLSTTKMAFLREGDSFFSVVGPLGRPAVVGHYGRVVLGGGCFGIGGIYPIAKKLRELGNHVTAIVEAKSSYMLYLDQQLGEVCNETILVTNDGSKGKKGFVYDVIEEMIDQEREIDHIKVIGCNIMMAKVSKLTKPHKIPTFVTVTTIMVDGTGMCGACRLGYDGKTKYACVDGPEFDGHKVEWDDLIKIRATGYLEDENLGYQNFAPECRSLRVYRERNPEEEIP